MSVFPLWYAPAVAPELGGTTKFEGQAKKSLNFKTVSAPMVMPTPFEY